MFIIRRVVGASMVPALLPGQLVCIKRKVKRIREGDIVVVRHQNLEKIKRVRKIKNAQFFVLGDNLPESTDSRSFGWLTRGQIVGKVCWPRRV